MLRFAAPACVAAMVLATGVGFQSQPVRTSAPQRAPFLLRLGRGRVVAPTAAGISVVVDASHGTFRALRRTTSPRAVLADGVAKLDGDRRPDLATYYNGSDNPDSCSEDSGVTVCTSWAYLSRGLPHGRFRKRRVVYTSDVNDIAGVAAGDVTGDRRTDLLVAFSNYYGDNGVDVLVNRGGGRFVRRRRFVSTGQPPVALAVVDVNGDGRLDLVTANSEVADSNRLKNGTVSVFLGAKGDLGRRRDYRVGGGGDGLAVRDMNADGKPDVVVSRGEAGPFVSVLLNRGDGTFASKQDYRGAARYAEGVTVADLNDDRRPDLVVAGGRGISVLLNRGAGRFGARITVASHDRVISVVAGDLNGDGRDDVLGQSVYGSPHAPLLVLLNTG